MLIWSPGATSPGRKLGVLTMAFGPIAGGPSTVPGDRAILNLTICAGFRVSELTALATDDLALAARERDLLLCQPHTLLKI
jgi:hypothetical protein